MKLKTLTFKEIKVNISQSRYPIKDKEHCKSLFQYNLGQILVKIYKNYPILEEFYIPQENLYLDFFIPGRMIAFEAQGEQHEKYNSFFYKEKFQFEKAKRRDVKKQEWCNLNSIRLVQVPYDKITIQGIKTLIEKEVFGA